MTATPRASKATPGTPRASSQLMKPRKAALATPRVEDDDDDLEAAQAAQLLAEVMLGTPRANAHPMTPRGQAALSNPLGGGLYPVKKEQLPVPLPSSIQTPSIVVQHSMKPMPTPLPPEEQLIARYDYLSPAEMQAQILEQEQSQQVDHQQLAGSLSPGPQQQTEASSPGSAMCASASVDVPVEEDEGWYVDKLLARRRLKGDGGANPGSWQYLVRWIGRGEEDDMWVPEVSIGRPLHACCLLREPILLLTPSSAISCSCLSEQEDLDPSFVAADLQEAATERAALSARGQPPAV